MVYTKSIEDKLIGQRPKKGVRPNTQYEKTNRPHAPVRDIPHQDKGQHTQERSTNVE